MYYIYGFTRVFFSIWFVVRVLCPSFGRLVNYLSKFRFVSIYIIESVLNLGPPDHTHSSPAEAVAG